MAYSIQREVSDGTLQTLTLRIAYFKKTHISVYVDDKLADGSAGYSWVWDGDRIRLNAVVPVGIEVMIRRKTPMDTPFHNFRQGAVFKDVTMDENFIQQLYINQESVEGLSATDFYSDLDLHSYRMKNVGTAISDADAVSLGQYRADALGANQYRILAENSKVAAKASEVASAASAAAALVSEHKTKASETAAKLSEVNSKASEDTVVPLVPIVDKAARDAAAASVQAALASADAQQAVIDVKNLGAVPIGTVLDFPRGSIPAGYLVANGSTFDTTTYPDLQAFLGSNKLPNVKARSTEMFSVEWWGGKRTSIPTGAVPADGQVLTDAVYPDAATEIAKGASSSVPVISEVEWATPVNRGCYTKANSTQFRVPDYNGKQANSLGAIFTRGDGANSAGAAGLMQGDAIRNITGSLYNRGGVYQFLGEMVTATGVFATDGNDKTSATPDTPGVSGPSRLDFDVSRVVPTASENRPVSATGCWIIWFVAAPVVPLIKAAGVLANEGMAQLDGVVQRLGAIESRTGSSGALSWRNRIINGAFQVNQRGLTFGLTSNAYTSDRWRVDANYAASININQQYMRVRSTAWPSVLQRIESVNIKDLTGKPITLSFNARITENLGAADVYIEVRKPIAGVDTWTNTEAVIHSINIGKLTNNFQRIPRTFTCDTSLGLEIKIVAMQGSGGVITLDVGEVQLEEGTVATPFEQRPYGIELALCQRYYRTGRISLLQHTSSTQAVGATVDGFVPMRVLPTLTWKQTYSNSAAFTYSAIQAPAKDLIRLVYSGVVGGAMDIDGIYTADAEL